METWLTYSAEDFLLFSAPVYWRLFELHNAAVWPGQIVAVLAGVVLLVLLVGRFSYAGILISIILALAWSATGLSFLPRYATINWLAADLVPVFLIQSGLLIALGGFGNALRPRAGPIRRWIGGSICVYGLALHPFLAIVDGRRLAGAELFALTPDPTAIVTLGIVVVAGGRYRTWALAIIPLTWCLASWATLATLGAWQAWILASVMLSVLTAGMISGKDQKPEHNS